MLLEPMKQRELVHFSLEATKPPPQQFVLSI